MGATHKGRRTRKAAVMLGAAALGSALMVAVSPAQQASAASSVPCTLRSLVTSLTSFGDSNNYFTVPNGTFENGTAGWSLLFAGTKPENEPWNVLSGPNKTSLGLMTGATVTSPTMCVATAEDSMRFFYKAPGNPMASLRVSVHVVSGLGLNTWDATYSVVSGSKAGWALSPRIPLPDIRDASGQQNVRITFNADGPMSNWLIDDVQIDPWKSV